MPEDTQQYSSDLSDTDDETNPLHTCACGEQHRHQPGSVSHRAECTSDKKFGDSCCCGSGKIPEGTRPCCCHGPQCQ